MEDQRTGPTDRREHNHYFKSVKGLDYIDVYMVLRLFNVTDPAIQHAVKKLLCMGVRGDKAVVSTADRDLKEAIDSLVRAQEMRAELAPKQPEDVDLVTLKVDIQRAIDQIETNGVDLEQVNRNRAPDQQFPDIDSFELYRQEQLKHAEAKKLPDTHTMPEARNIFKDMHDFLVVMRDTGMVVLRSGDNETPNGRKARMILRRLREIDPSLTA